LVDWVEIEKARIRRGAVKLQTELGDRTYKLTKGESAVLNSLLEYGGGIDEDADGLELRDIRKLVGYVYPVIRLLKRGYIICKRDHYLMTDDGWNAIAVVGLLEMLIQNEEEVIAT